MNTLAQTTFRAATVNDCPTAARLMQLASDGVCDYIWSLQQDEFPGLSRLEVGAKQYATAEGNYSYRSCLMAFTTDDQGQEQAQGMMMAYQISPASTESEVTSEEIPEEMLGIEVLTPYMLAQPNSWYICALAVFPQYQGQGLGTQFLALAAAQAHEQGLPHLSLLCFEQNVGALRLYQRHGFGIVDRAHVVPHPLIHHTGDILLMTKPV